MRHWWAIVAVLVGVAGCALAPVQFERRSDDPIEHGQRLAAVLGCSGCHAADLTGNDWSKPGFARMWSSNLTRAVPRLTDTHLGRAIRSGVRRDGTPLWGMPSFLFTQLQPGEMAAITAFLRSRPAAGADHPLPVFGAGARAEIAAGTFLSSSYAVKKYGDAWPPEVGAAFARGRSIVRATCAECHGMDLRGGVPHPGATARPDLRMVAAYDAAQFDRLLQAGIPIGGHKLGLMAQVARGRFSHFTASERTAVHGYLRQVAKVAP